MSAMSFPRGKSRLYGEVFSKTYTQRNTPSIDPTWALINIASYLFPRECRTRDFHRIADSSRTCHLSARAAINPRTVLYRLLYARDPETLVVAVPRRVYQIVATGQDKHCWVDRPYVAIGNHNASLNAQTNGIGVASITAIEIDVYLRMTKCSPKYQSSKT